MESQESRKTMGIKTNTFLGRDKIIKSNSQYKDDQYIYIPHDKVPIVEGQEVFGVINFPMVFYT
jgi:hypothetical protein